ncbi:oligosaccharide flippase family protein [Sphingomonas floccifaciens]|uniref:Oligosaccharide flippase family protein n=1 Tax=Sphingomonas floccifaciens TaxID=1844115 RepID=A0ABW4N9U6_9SPHN
MITLPRARVSRANLSRVGWTTGSYAVVQVLRLANNVILARLLAPELFGIMLIVNTVRTGIELLSDIGIGQNVVRAPDAEEPRFYNTAWTLQVIRGLLLGGLCLAASIPLSNFYDSPVLAKILPVASLFFIFTGFESIGRALLQKRIDVVRLGIFEIGTTIFSVIAYIVLALITPTIWALMLGGVLSSAALMLGSYLLIPGLRPKFAFDRDVAIRMFSFGRWVFLSTVVYFLAMNFDRLYMAKALPLAVLGVYGIARSLADILTLLANRLSNMVIFPMVARASDDREGLRQALTRSRPLLLAAAAVATSLFAALSDLIVGLLYDSRYHEAAQMLPILAFGVWFAVLATINEAVVMGIGRPVYSAIANVSKLICLCIGLPVAVVYHGITGAVWVIAGSEAVRYLPLWWSQRREGLPFGVQDIALTAAAVGMFVLWRAALWAVGLASGIFAFTAPSVF